MYAPEDLAFAVKACLAAVDEMERFVTLSALNLYDQPVMKKDIQTLRDIVVHLQRRVGDTPLTDSGDATTNAANLSKAMTDAANK